MLRVCRLLPCREVAARVPAVGSGNLQVIVISNVTAQAGHIRVPIGQRETDRRSGVVNRYSKPTVERMTRFAILWELAADMVGHVPAHRLSLLVILQVT